MCVCVCHPTLVLILRQARARSYGATVVLSEIIDGENREITVRNDVIFASFFFKKKNGSSFFLSFFWKLEAMNI